MAGKQVLPKEDNEVSDSNVITPGTVFMDKLAKALEYYIRLRLNTDPGWKPIKVILSDSNVPGEGEHKIMSFIRLQRSLPGYNPNTRHCLYGLDADLIMLALATHEIHFSILREDVIKRGQDEFSVASVSANFSSVELDMIKSRQWFHKVFATNSKIPKKPYQFLNVWTLRECLELDLKIVDAPFDIDFERIIDDFIFICFFTGNDFLPHVPTLEIHEGAVDLLIYVYKKVLKTNGGYLVDTSRMKEKTEAYVKLKRIERFILEVGTYEDKIFKKRYKLRQKFVERCLNQKLEEQTNDFDNLRKQDDTEDRDLVFSLPQNCMENVMHSQGCSSLQVESIERSEVVRNTNKLKQKVKDLLRNKTDLFKNGVLDNDKVKLGYDSPDGWKTRYYRVKFSAGNPAEIETIRKKIVEKYIEGLCWMLHYYFSGVRSWSWYYPFYHGPFASDLKGLACPTTEIQISKPFKPFDQLMAVLPPRSSNALPKAYRNLMTSENSTLIKFYPQDYVVDTDGKKFSWQGVCKLPFIDERELLTANGMIEKELEVNEVDRNSIKHDKIFVGEFNALGSIIANMQKSKDSTERKGMDADSSEINGYITLCHNSCCRSTSLVTRTEGIVEDCVLSAKFENPDHHDHIPQLLGQPPEKTITEADIMERKLWHEFDSSCQPISSNHYRYARTNEDASKSVPENAREKWIRPGAGWNGLGMGAAAAESSHSSSGHGGNFGKGHAFADQHQGNNVGTGYQSAESWQAMRNSIGFGQGNGEFQHSAGMGAAAAESSHSSSGHGGNFGRGRGFTDQHRPFRAQGNNVGRGFQSAESWQVARNSSGFGRGNGEFQHSSGMGVATAKSSHSSSEHGGNFGRGRGFADHRPFRAQGNNAGRGYQSAEPWQAVRTSSGFDRVNREFQHSSGMGAAAAESSHSSSGHGGNFGRGRGFADQHRPFRAQGNNVGRGYQSAEPRQAVTNSSGFGRGNGEFQFSYGMGAAAAESSHSSSGHGGNLGRGRAFADQHRPFRAQGNNVGRGYQSAEPRQVVTNSSGFGLGNGEFQHSARGPRSENWRERSTAISDRS